MSAPLSNFLLESLPPDYRTSLIALMTNVSLPLGTVLYRPNEMPEFAYFMTSGMVSIVTFMMEGKGVEVGIVGREGMVGGVQLLGDLRGSTTAFMQVEGAALRVSFAELTREFRSHEQLRSLILRTVQSQMLQLAQIAACNTFHEVEEKLARWLLMVQDKVGGDEIELTQEFLSEMLGVGRPTLTVAAQSLQRRGLIKYSRGTVNIKDRSALEKAACECYPIVRNFSLSFELA